ncbi:Protein of uncharacterised function (DUF2580) [Mycobacteroides abscessus]|uniref:ESX-1 secretion-associated protein n=2 Tax=Mycolicibacterium TaxID=1866885 RepID=A0A0D1KY97_9MYCO|nr:MULTISPECIES: type VII secretion target [Mycobacteriaceae]KIU13795.1 hypothetical protein TL10_27825 [Mycolicibacterium llatzerense]MCQ4360232.1 type VII secretion target [Mycobacterium gordonae]MCT7373245.1 hypothetical protein [Mycolicibacterium llatzerense]WGI35872.1 type VII secretion target [Mycolicibacterium aubagnense]CPT81026.1 Protein of uncharacterised function (DUF2580) [Mycobacteroides abscessus]
MAEAIKVDAEGLRSHAAMCDIAAAALSAAAAPAPTGHLTQATVSAVQHGHTSVRGVLTALAVRATSTGDTLRAAAGAYAATDDDSAQSIRTLQV